MTSQDPTTAASLNPILGGPGWQARLNPNLPPGQAVEKLFRETLKEAGNFRYVMSTKIDRSTVDRPHFFLAYGTNDEAGLKAFRQTEFRALNYHEADRGKAKRRTKQARTGMADLFDDADHPEDATLDELVAEAKEIAKKELVKELRRIGKPVPFSRVCAGILESFMLRETNAKDMCVELADEGIIRNSWAEAGSRQRKPSNDDLIIIEE